MLPNHCFSQPPPLGREFTQDILNMEAESYFLFGSAYKLRQQKNFKKFATVCFRVNSYQNSVRQLHFFFFLALVV